MDLLGGCLCGDLTTSVLLSGGQSVVFSAVCSLPADLPPLEYTNTATVSYQGGDCADDPANNFASDTDLVLREPDLGVTITDGLTTVIAGQPVSYEIEVTNDGPSDAPGSSLSQTVTGLDGCSACLR